MVVLKRPKQSGLSCQGSSFGKEKTLNVTRIYIKGSKNTDNQC
jgi:hypothetical protein